MQTETILLIVVAFIIAIVVAMFQYIYKSKQRTRLTVFFAFLRFITIFSILILLINPSIKSRTFYTVRPTLLVVADNSSSIENLGYQELAKETLQRFEESSALRQRFEISHFNFSNSVHDSLLLNFSGNQSNIDHALTELNQVYRNSRAPIILLTDGNQTFGNAYHYPNANYKQQVFPIVLGDSSKIKDVRIKQLNVNRYAYLKNDFPIEVLVTYNGDAPVSTTLEIRSKDRVLKSKKVNFSKQNKSIRIPFNLSANTVGVTTYSATILPLNKEKNTINNQKIFAVEVIDQKTNILVVSDIIHPDLGAIKKSVESNERSSITIKKPGQVSNLDGYAMVILYQPTSQFKKVLRLLDDTKINRFTIAGRHTDWNFLNAVQSRYKHDYSRQTEYFIPEFNSDYRTFLSEDIGFDNYPPLLGRFGELKINAKYDALLYKVIGSVLTSSPLLATIEEQNSRETILLGEGLWKWRMYSFKNDKSFETFDDFFSNLIQYLSSSQKRSRLMIFAESFYYSNAQIVINAEYFTKNYEFDDRASLAINLKKEETGQELTFPMILSKNAYQVDLSSLSPGTYQYTVTVKGESLRKSGIFKILEYDVEKQFLNADFSKLQALAENTDGKLYTATAFDSLQNDLLTDPRYQPIQKSKENIVSLIDWKYLLLIMLFSLSIEWFLRKYYGKI
ncbi:VWA domain-containing protein [Aquimarina intermedia]|uniref:VWA domain-containing protein n=1 Tax=Aquimarina intermedia TaxID=350814 RepID=A0A5S5C9J6_9FLAO|nr:VWA domain-containing protein [Aquimarina intermedia]TYP75046.1 hypothetical protein BD809_103108 [Aquimarina intermedia]